MISKPTFPFFVGRGRSGTTLLRTIFDSHPDMAIPYESHFPVSMAVVRGRYEGSDSFDLDAFELDLLGHWGYRRWGLEDEETRRALRRECPSDFASAIRTVYGIFASNKGKHRYGEKTPSFVIHIDLLSRIFPESRFIHVIRDGRNVALSYRDAGWGPKTLTESALYWKRFVNKGRSSGEKLGPSRYMEILYEDLVTEPEENVRSVCSFIGLDYDAAMLRYFERPDAVPRGLRPHLERGHQNLRLPPTKVMRDWRNQMTKVDAATFYVLSGDLLAELGYEPSPPAPTATVRIRAAKGWLGTHARRAARKARKSFARSSIAGRR